jgi:hypothetical protein
VRHDLAELQGARRVVGLAYEPRAGEGGTLAEVLRACEPWAKALAVAA